MPPARNGLSLACNGCPFQDHHSKVNVPGLLLRSVCRPLPLPVRPAGSATWIGLPQPTPLPRLPARCRFRFRLPDCSPASTPLRDFYLPRDQSVPLVGRPAAYLPNPPDLRSLPAALNYLTSTGLRITVPGSLRFRRLAVPRTSWNLPQYAPTADFRQRLFDPGVNFSSYYLRRISNELQIETVNCLWINQDKDVLFGCR
jgi:hypothetical protein